MKKAKQVVASQELLDRVNANARQRSEKNRAVIEKFCPPRPPYSEEELRGLEFGRTSRLCAVARERALSLDEAAGLLEGEEGI